jgi:hypothetical protein
MASSVLLLSCKKSSNSGTSTPNYNDSTQFTQSVSIKIIATIPSPSDLVNTPLADSITIDTVRVRGQNPTGIDLNVYNPAFTSAAGFTFGYAYEGVYPFDRQMISIDANAIPSVEQNFITNKTYDNTSVTIYEYSPVFLEMRGYTNGHCGKYFVDSVPADASDTAVSDTTYCNITFTNKFTSVIQNDTIHYASGVISGYEALHYSKTNPAKYTQRWDFNISFENIAYNLTNTP